MEAYKQRELARAQDRLNARRSELFKAANVPDKHRKTIPGGPNVYTDWWSAFHWARHAVKANGIIALVGDRGTGKTQIAVEIIRNETVTAEHPQTCLYTRAAEVFSAVRECYGPQATTKESVVVARFVRPWLLVIDEAHDRGHTPAEGRMLNLILDTRYGGEKPTVFIANATPQEFREQIGESIFDRISETGGILECLWKSFRVKGGE